MKSYSEYLAGKAQGGAATGFEPTHLPGHLFGFQAHVVDWAVRQGRGATYLDCGMGKSLVALAWAENVHQHTGKPVLITTPLAVAFQFEREAAKFGITDAAVSRDGSIPAAITITNYEQVEKFDPSRFGGVVCDESSALKAFDGSRRAIVTEFLRTVPYRLLATATAAPNDYIELGTSSEALGYLGHMDMLNRFFTNKLNTSATNRYRGQQAAWRFKGWAEDPFWRWVASWARAARKPSDLDYPDDGFVLPALQQRTHIVEARTVREGQLFDLPAQGLHEEREEIRRTINERCELAADLLADVKTGVAWCHLNDEGDLLERLIPGAVQVSGSDSPEEKEEKLIGFATGDVRVLVTKPKIGAWGLNWQHCNRMTYFPSWSYEQWYQAVRRCWRFGQDNPVLVDIITTEGGRSTMDGLQRKAGQADAMFAALVTHMNDARGITPGVTYDQEVKVPTWLS